MNNIENVNECPWCGSKKSFKWCEDKEPFLTVQCNNCNIVYVKRRLNQKGREEFYKNYNTEIHQQAAEKKLREEMYQLENKFITEFIDKGNVLDVGCAEGGLGANIKEKHNNQDQIIIDGIEISQDQNIAIEFYSSIYNSLNQVISSNKRYDIIIYSHVLEHIIDIHKEFNNINKILKKDDFENKISKISFGKKKHYLIKII